MPVCVFTVTDMRAPPCAQAQTVELAAFYEHRLREGAKAVFHIEAFIAKFMAMYKSWALTQFA